MAVDTADEHALHVIQQAQVVQALFHVQCHLDIVFFREAILIDKLFQSMTNIVDHRSRLRRKGPEIPTMGAFCPQGCHHDLSCNRRNARQNIAEPPRHQADHDIQNAVCRHCRQHLPINQLRNSLQRHPECIVDFSQQEEQHRKQTDHGPVASPAKLCIDLIRIIQLPTKCKRNCDHYQIDDFYDLQHHIMLKF